MSTTASPSIRACARSKWKARRATSCCSIIRKTRSSTCRSSAWTSSRSIAPAATAPNPCSTAWAASPGSARSRASSGRCATWPRSCCASTPSKMHGGQAYSADTPWQQEFENGFEFDETPDQLTALADIKRDLESPQPMDRLLCGDVGYGKTELAMRAGFKVVQDGRQVAVLAPTTVLAFQHFTTFSRRMAGFPVRIEMVSRFRSAAEIKKALAETEAGKVDILIGTHRLLSKDVSFHSLGLLIVDEEQRFGVAAKEKLKKMSAGIDVLTLSATPIPRTLNMSLGGLRDLSVIETPPRGRLAIQTVVASFGDGMVQAAILQEMSRQGQVYFVHNRVESIWSMAALVQKLVPTARIGVAHGQMHEKELERVMLKFVQGEYDVLVSTVLIENGLDIPRANTLIVNHAER